MQDIISDILKRRREDVSSKGFNMALNVPLERERKIVPFLQNRGVILEIKRASPSKGDIAPKLDAASTALSYIDAGAAAISVLTEEHWFKGSLYDLISVAKAAGDRVSVLRKDFLFSPEEVDISYRCGADAILIIARMLDEKTIEAMLERVAARGIAALIELRSEEDIDKAKKAALSLADKMPRVVYGVNARDLKDFSIDALRPAIMLSRIKKEIEGSLVITESGVLTPRAAKMAGAMGFHALLLGEAAVREVSNAKRFVEGFNCGTENRNSAFWHNIAKKLSTIRSSSYRPLIKICGFTSVKDAIEAAAFCDILGFVFWQKSKRCASQDVVRQGRMMIDSMDWAEGKKPLLVGVVADDSLLSKTALSLAQEGVLDAIQFHSCCVKEIMSADYDEIGHYAAVSVGSMEDIENIRALTSSGEMRVLADAKMKKLPGGTGFRVPNTLCIEAAKISPLWLAGGITADNVSKIVKELRPEMIDIASGVEASPGIKNMKKIEALSLRARNALE